MLLRARWLLPVSSPPIEDGAVLVRSGRIRAVGAWRLISSEHPEEKVRDLGAAVLLPGFVNSHAHLELTLLRGLIGDLPYFRWIRRLVQAKADGLKHDEYVFYSLLGAAEMIRGGITCVADCSDSGASFDALALSGLRGVVFQEVFAPAAAHVATATTHLAERLDGLQAMADQRVRVGISPHSPYMACRELLEEVAAIASARSLPLSIHACEAEDEVAFVRDGAGPIAEHHLGRSFPVAATGLRPLEYLAGLGWLQLPVPVQFVHLARASAPELDLLGAAVADGRLVSAALCPRSNASLGNGLPDFQALTARGIPWGLGTDGAPAVGGCDLFSEMRFAFFAQRAVASDPAAVPTADLVARATLHAARALGLEAAIGSLEVGKQADLVAVRLDGAASMPAFDPCSTLVQSAQPADVLLTMVGGDVLFDGQTIATLDEQRVIARCRERADVLAALLARRRV